MAGLLTTTRPSSHQKMSKMSAHEHSFSFYRFGLAVLLCHTHTHTWKTMEWLASLMGVLMGREPDSESADFAAFVTEPCHASDVDGLVFAGCQFPLQHP